MEKSCCGSIHNNLCLKDFTICILYNPLKRKLLWMTKSCCVQIKSEVDMNKKIGIRPILEKIETGSVWNEIGSKKDHTSSRSSRTGLKKLTCLKKKISDQSKPDGDMSQKCLDAKVYIYIIFVLITHILITRYSIFSFFLLLNFSASFY